MGGNMSARIRILAVLGTVTATLFVVGLLELTGRAQGETLLTGRITSGAGEKMEGVTVSARRFGSTFTTSVFTDAAGEYYFPRLQQGKYKIWAQAVGFDAAIFEDATLNGAILRQDAVLKPLANYEM